MSFTGLLLKESLADPGLLDRLNVSKIETWEPGEAGAPGPPVWTAVTFEGEEQTADETAELISGAMHDSYWYANIHCPVDEIVIFAGRIFRYVRGDATARAPIEDYARSLGIPDHQLDWERSENG